MAQALDPAAYIFEGFWQNLGKDSSHSLTLTLSPRNATILTNTLALFVAMSGGQLWTIIRFTLHQIRAASRPETFDMTHTQQQIVLRNATTDVATARLMLNLAWASRENAKKAMATCLTIFILAILNATLFMAAGTFSNTLVDAGSEVLSRSPHCGLFNQTYLDLAANGPNPSSEEAFELSVEYTGKSLRDVEQSVEYVNNCYMSQPTQSWASTCGSMQAPRLNWTTIYNASCPFGVEVCSDNSPTIVLDTGVIDTHSGLGINAQPGDRLGYRRVTTCTALNDTGHTTNWIVQNDSSLQAYANYGPNVFWETNETYSYSNFAEFFTKFTGVSTIPYQINTQVAFGEVLDNYPVLTYSTFDPIAPLIQSNADTTLVFLSYQGKYTGPVNDPWFSAHNISHRNSTFPLVSTNFARDKPIGTMGCTEQHQICITEGVCTPLVGFDQVQQSIAADIRLSPNQNVTLGRLMLASQLSLLSSIIENLATTSTPLLALNFSQTATSSLSLPVPDDQWQREVGYWHAIAMAHLQRTLIEYGTGQIAPRTTYLIPSTSGTGAWFCQNIMIRSTVFSSFNVVALALLIGFGALIIGLSLTIEKTTSWLQQRWNRGRYGRRMWTEHDMLGFQLKRAQSLRSPHGSIPVGQQNIFEQGVQLGIMSPAVSRYYPSGLPNGMSPTPASSKAHSPYDDARQFGNLPPPPSPSPIRSAFTAEFAFDFGSAGAQAYGHSNATGKTEKPLPGVPEPLKAFCIDRGTNDAASDSSGSVECTDKPTEVAAQAFDRPAPQMPPEQQGHVENLRAAGPGRWAYYSAHKRRYGPKLTVREPRINISIPSEMRNPFGERNQGNWI